MSVPSNNGENPGIPPDRSPIQSDGQVLLHSTATLFLTLARIFVLTGRLSIRAVVFTAGFITRLWSVRQESAHRGGIGLVLTEPAENHSENLSPVESIPVESIPVGVPEPITAPATPELPTIDLPSPALAPSLASSEPPPYQLVVPLHASGPVDNEAAPVAQSPPPNYTLQDDHGLRLHELTLEDIAIQDGELSDGNIILEPGEDVLVLEPGEDILVLEPDEDVLVLEPEEPLGGAIYISSESSGSQDGIVIDISDSDNDNDASISHSPNSSLEAADGSEQSDEDELTEANLRAAGELEAAQNPPRRVHWSPSIPDSSVTSERVDMLDDRRIYIADPSRSTRWYVVSHGRTPGVFDNW